MAHRSQSFAYGTKKEASNHSNPIVYSALLSRIAIELRQRITLSDHIKDDIEYKNTFDGKEVVDKICLIIQKSDRKLALRLGRLLSSQRFFHDVSYETQLVDSSIYLYEFTNRTLYTLTSPRPLQGSSSDCWSESESGGDVNATELLYNNHMPNGIITDLTHCYVPTCWDIKPCYSPICPKRLLQIQREDSSDSLSDLLTKSSTLFQKSSSFNTTTLHHDYWADNVDKTMYDSLTKMERKRQENLYELIYTEKDYVQSLEYLQTMWIKPLTERPIIPSSRREGFIRKVFGNIENIHLINIRLLRALQARQSQHTIIYQIGDVLLNFVTDFEPYIKYGSKQYEAKFALENERYINSNFDAFVNATERHPSSLKLEVNGFLTKPTTRLGRYTLLFKEILKHTPPDHPDLEDLPKAVTIIKRFLSRVNIETGQAKNRFDLERIHYNLSFKYKFDEMNLDLLNKNRSIIKQGTLKKSCQPESVEYQVILFDHYLVVAKLKIANGTERYVIQKRPIPIELLSVYLPDTSLNGSKRSSTLLLPYLTPNHTTNPGMQGRSSTDLGPYTTSASVPNTKLNQHPIAFQHLGRNSTTTHFTLYASSPATRKPWLEKIRLQQEEKNKKSPIFEIIPAVREHEFIDTNKINHFITFNGGQQYLLASDDGVYVGHHNYKYADTTPHKVLALDKVTQIHTIEPTETLLVLADKTLWEYPLYVVNGKPATQPAGRLVQTHVPFFFVGICLKRTVLCVPRISTLKSVISTFEAVRGTENMVAVLPANTGNMVKRSTGFIDRMLTMRSLTLPSDELHLKKIKDCYVPCEAYAVELSASMMLITSSRGMIMVDMRTDKPQQLLNPSDRNLAFILEREKEVSSSLNLRQPIKRIAIFRTPRNHYFICYDEYAFYIDSKGNRLFNKFLIEWEGTPESFAFSYPYVMAFDSSFIEVRNVITGAIEQIIRGKSMKCINTGHKTELPLIFGCMLDPVKPNFQHVFKIQLVDNNVIDQDTSVEPSTLRRS
ncbi:hypothetical protein HPULCUR_004851 [Helicostylum pulchrum]|uniref:RHO1 GDP-GTP exchange protein 2 n=1 Tax=Helicostylum pulchrum TaxID=562976 RepID=A0ABP9XXJ7_9FUNG